MEWPADADGDVLRQLEADECDFTEEHPIEFCVDFEKWPPPPQALVLLSDRFGAVSWDDPEAGSDGYVICTIEAKITYEFVTRIQQDITALLTPLGGKCDTWGVFS
jgi:hypothetical protein